MFLYMQKTAYELATLLEFRRVLFRSVLGRQQQQARAQLGPVVLVELAVQQQDPLMEQPEPGAVGERRAGAFGGGAGVGEGRWVRSSCGHAPSVRPLRVLAHRYPPCADPSRAELLRAELHRPEPRDSTSPFGSMPFVWCFSCQLADTPWRRP